MALVSFVPKICLILFNSSIEIAPEIQLLISVLLMLKVLVLALAQVVVVALRNSNMYNTLFIIVRV